MAIDHWKQRMQNLSKICPSSEGTRARKESRYCSLLNIPTNSASLSEKISNAADCSHFVSLSSDGKVVSKEELPGRICRSTMMNPYAKIESCLAVVDDPEGKKSMPIAVG